jgi:hypothetical protein
LAHSSVERSLHNARSDLAAPLAAASIESYHHSSQYLVQLSSLFEIEQVATLLQPLSTIYSSSSLPTSDEYRSFDRHFGTMLTMWDSRLRVSQPLFQTGELMLSVRLGLLLSLETIIQKWASDVSEYKNSFLRKFSCKITKIIKENWVSMGRLARRQGLYGKAAHAIDTALLRKEENEGISEVSDAKITFERAKLMWNSGKPRHTIVQHLDSFLQNDIDPTLRSKALLLRAKSLEETGHTTTEGF